MVQPVVEGIIEYSTVPADTTSAGKVTSGKRDIDTHREAGHSEGQKLLSRAVVFLDFFWCLFFGALLQAKCTYFLDKLLGEGQPPLSLLDIISQG